VLGALSWRVPTIRPRLRPRRLPAIVNHYGPEFHIYGVDGRETAAALIRKALSEQAGGVIPGRTQQ
jgi:hypothetical protein